MSILLLSAGFPVYCIQPITVFLFVSEDGNQVVSDTISTRILEGLRDRLDDRATFVCISGGKQTIFPLSPQDLAVSVDTWDVSLFFRFTQFETRQIEGGLYTVLEGECSAITRTEREVTLSGMIRAAGFDAADEKTSRINAADDFIAQSEFAVFDMLSFAPLGRIIGFKPGGFAIVRLGSRDGVHKGQELYYPVDAYNNPDYRVVIETVAENQSIGRIIPVRTDAGIDHELTPYPVWIMDSGLDVCAGYDFAHQALYPLVRAAAVWQRDVYGLKPMISLSWSALQPSFFPLHLSLGFAYAWYAGRIEFVPEALLGIGVTFGQTSFFSHIGGETVLGIWYDILPSFKAGAKIGINYWNEIEGEVYGGFFAGISAKLLF